MFEAPRGYSVLGGQREATTRDDDDDLLQFAIQQSLLEAGSEYDQVHLRRPCGGFPTGTTVSPPQLTGSHPAPQVTIWEALTNSKPGTHPMSYEGRRQDRSVPARPEKVSKRLCPHPRLHIENTTGTLSTAHPATAGWAAHLGPKKPRSPHRGPCWCQGGVLSQPKGGLRAFTDPHQTEVGLGSTPTGWEGAREVTRDPLTPLEGGEARGV